MFSPTMAILKDQPMFLVGDDCHFDWMSHLGVHWLQDNTKSCPIAYEWVMNFRYQGKPLALNTDQRLINIGTSLGVKHFYSVLRLYRVNSFLGEVNGKPTLELVPITMRATETMEPIQVKVSDIHHCRRTFNPIKNHRNVKAGVITKPHDRVYTAYHPNGKLWEFTLSVDPTLGITTDTLVEEYLMPVKCHASKVQQYAKAYRSFSGRRCAPFACELKLS